MSKDKKAQITVFIIIGLLLILLMAVVFFFVFSQDKGVDLINIKTSKEISTAVQNYVDACLKPIVLNGVEIMRLQGGYIEIPDNVEYEIIKDPNSEYITEIGGSKQVVIDENAEGNKVPYWVTKTGTAIPSLSYLNSDLDSYVTSELDKCLNDFKSFKDLNYEVEVGDLNVDITFGDSVVADVSLPLRVQKDELFTDQDKFTYSVPVNIPLLHSISAQLAAEEASLAYIEFNSNNLWCLYSGVREDLLPPFRETRVNQDGSYVTWSLDGVKSTFNSVLAANMRHVQVMGTDYPSQEGIYKSMEFDLLDKSYPDVIIQHVYLSPWDFHNFKVNPSPMMPSVFEQLDIPLLSSLYVMKYKFRYFAEYTVLIDVNDKKSAKLYPELNTYDKEKGHKWQFLEYVAIYGNQAREFVPNPYRVQQNPDGTTDYPSIINVDYLGSQGITVLEDTYFCEENQRMSGDITISVYDPNSNENLSGVNLWYECGSSENNCLIGNTKNGTLVTKFPYCQNGILKLSKPDYITKKVLLTIEDQYAKNLRFSLDSLYKFNATLMKYKMDSPSSIGQLMPLQNGDRVMLTLSKIGDSSFGSSQMFTFGTSAQSNEVVLGVGSYQITGQLITNGFTIPARCKRICIEKNSDDDCTKYEYMPEDPLPFGSHMMLGGVELNSATGYWTLTSEQLRNSNNLVFYVIQVPTPNCIDDASGQDEECNIAGTECVGIDEINKVSDYSMQFKSNVIPRLS